MVHMMFIVAFCMVLTEYNKMNRDFHSTVPRNHIQFSHLPYIVLPVFVCIVLIRRPLPKQSGLQATFQFGRDFGIESAVGKVFEHIGKIKRFWMWFICHLLVRLLVLSYIFQILNLWRLYESMKLMKIFQLIPAINTHTFWQWVRFTNLLRK